MEYRFTNVSYTVNVGVGGKNVADSADTGEADEEEGLAPGPGPAPAPAPKNGNAAGNAAGRKSGSSSSSGGKYHASLAGGSSSGLPGEKKLLDNVSGSLCAGQVMAILGPSGAGKTTLVFIHNRSRHVLISKR